MRTPSRLRTLAFLLIGTLCIALLAACTPGPLPRMTIQATHRFKASARAAGLSVAIDPFIEQERLQHFFGVYLPSRGILPVLVSIENTQAPDAYVLLKEQSQLVIRAKDQLPPSAQAINPAHQTDSLKSALHTRQALGWATVVSPIMVFALGLAGDAYLREVEILRSLEDKHITDKTVYPGSVHSGFLYFPLERIETIGNVEGVKLMLSNIRTRESLEIVVWLRQE